MDFPIVDLLDEELSAQWLMKHFHPEGLKCPHCQASVQEARKCRTTQTSRLMVYRCHYCHGIYNLYSGTIFAHKQLRPSQAVLLFMSERLRFNQEPLWKIPSPKPMRCFKMPAKKGKSILMNKIRPDAEPTRREAMGLMIMTDPLLLVLLDETVAKFA